jgi:hypothetical protein
MVDGTLRSDRRWLREHAPLVYLGVYTGADDVARAAEHRRRRELDELARVRRDALAFCVDCHYPLIATEQGFQFCPYDRARQHCQGVARAQPASSDGRNCASTRRAARHSGPLRAKGKAAGSIATLVRAGSCGMM